MNNIKKSNKLKIEELKVVKKLNKLKNNTFDIFFFDIKTGNKIEKLTVKEVGKGDIHYLEEYVQALKTINKSPQDISFNSYIESKERFNDNHFIWSLIKQAYFVEARLSPIIGEYDYKIKESYNKLIELEKSNEINISTWVYNIDSISDDIFGTTTMEWEIVDKEYIEKVLSNRNISWTTLSEKEAINIINWFIWGIENSLKEIKLSVLVLNEVHKINTVWLDEYVIKGLKYNPWKIREYGVDMWIFNKINWKTEYTPPENPKGYIENLVDYFNTWNLNILKLANLHLFLYAIHPFSNWNKRTTRVIESLYIQKLYDKGHYFKWMWYWFKKNINTYLKQIKSVLTWKTTLKQWDLFYMNSFVDMCKYSVFEAKNLKNDLSKVISKDRIRYYNDKDRVFYRFYLKNIDKLFTVRDIFTYLQKNNIEYSDEKQITKRLSKHIFDNIIVKTDNKEGKRALYRFNIN